MSRPRSFWELILRLKTPCRFPAMSCRAPCFIRFNLRGSNPATLHGIFLVSCYFIARHHGGSLNVRNREKEGGLFLFPFLLPDHWKAGNTSKLGKFLTPAAVSRSPNINIASSWWLTTSPSSARPRAIALEDEYDVSVPWPQSEEEPLRLRSGDSYPVVILLDLCMNGLSGIETLKRLRQIQETQKVHHPHCEREHGERDLRAQLRRPSTTSPSLLNAPTPGR